MAQGTIPCIPPRKNRKIQYHYDKQLYRQRHKIENISGRIRDWCRVATLALIRLSYPQNPDSA